MIHARRDNLSIHAGTYGSGVAGSASASATSVSVAIVLMIPFSFDAIDMLASTSKVGAE